MKRAFLCCAFLLGTACADDGRSTFSFPVRARGAAPRDVSARNGWTLRLTGAQVAFGPVYLCASKAASPEFCQVAVAEMRSVVVVDGLAAGRQDVGSAEGTSGTVESAQYDLGITWTPTQQRAAPLTDALGGHSVRLAGVATRAGETRTFTAEVDLTPQNQGTRTVQGARTSHHLDVHSALTVNVDPHAWLPFVDMDEFAAEPGDVRMVEGTRSHNALVLGLTANAPPALTWENAP